MTYRVLNKHKAKSIIQMGALDCLYDVTIFALCSLLYAC